MNKLEKDPDTLGIDLAKNLPTCMACRKQADGCKKIGYVVLCGTHYDEFLRQNKLTAVDFAKSLREGKFKPCWDASLEEINGSLR
jgi:hypothetical protein